MDFLYSRWKKRSLYYAPCAANPQPVAININSFSMKKHGWRTSTIITASRTALAASIAFYQLKIKT